MEVIDISHYKPVVLINCDQGVITEMAPPQEKFLKDSNGRIYIYTNHTVFGVAVYEECTEEFYKKEIGEEA